uniref:Immunoglobulin domain-containing protein n=1 Tax=Chrysemys picta bellii TaxID=8478 RepID=A0A8C3HT18_CHRPI
APCLMLLAQRKLWPLWKGIQEPVPRAAGSDPPLSYPKPNITLSPSGAVSLRGAIIVQCRGQRRGMRFVLNKERRHFPFVDSKGFEAVFTSSNVRREDGGSYSCFYHSRSEPFTVSYPSDPVELVVRGEGLPSPSISLSPTGVTALGADVTIQCQGQRRDVRFFLHKAGDLNLQRHVDPAGDVAKFRICNVDWQHGGNYSCSYRHRSQPFVSSYPSSSVELVVAGEGGDSVTGGFPSHGGAAAPGSSGLREGEFRGSCSGLSQGMLPRLPPSRGATPPPRD